LCVLREANPQGGPTPPEAPRAVQRRVEWRWGRFPSPPPPLSRAAKGHAGERSCVVREANPQGWPTPPEAPRAAPPRVERRRGRLPSPVPHASPRTAGRNVTASRRAMRL
jgi:hypothetical protein